MESTLLNNAIIAYRQKYGKNPEDDGYLIKRIFNKKVIFAKTEEAYEAYISAQELSKRTTKIVILCFLAITILFCLFIASQLENQYVYYTFLTFIILLLSFTEHYDRRQRWKITEKEIMYGNKIVIFNGKKIKKIVTVQKH